jgi:hypothetical protein
MSDLILLLSIYRQRTPEAQARPSNRGERMDKRFDTESSVVHRAVVESKASTGQDTVIAMLRR